MIRTLAGASIALLLAASVPPHVHAQTAAAAAGQHDFDWEIGTWHTHLRMLARPLSGSTVWSEMDGTSVVRKVMDGRSNLVELSAKNDSSKIEGLSLRLFNPQTGQWSVHYANIRSGMLDKPVIGEFKAGRGEFYSQDTFNGRAILVRFVIIPVSPDNYRFEQSFSTDGGKSWELNWVATDTRGM
jgi:hypothetical protein